MTRKYNLYDLTENSKNIEILLNNKVTRINFENIDGVYKAISVISNEKEYIAENEIILGTDPLSTCELLYESGIGIYIY